MKIKLLFFFLAVLLVQQGWSQEYLNKQDLAAMKQAKNGVMRVLLTTNKVDSLSLRASSLPVNLNDTNYKQLASLLLTTVTDSVYDGVGIAAPQVGINKQMFLIQRFDKEGNPFEVFINPSIYWTSNLVQTGREGCLSIPGINGMVDRYYAIGITYQDINGAWQKEILEGFTAIIFQHEFDHLVGIFFTDRLLEQANKTYIQPSQQYKWLQDKNTR